MVSFGRAWLVGGVSFGRAWLVEVEHGTQVVHVLAYAARQRNHDPLLNEYK